MNPSTLELIQQTTTAIQQHIECMAEHFTDQIQASGKPYHRPTVSGHFKHTVLALTQATGDMDTVISLATQLGKRYAQQGLTARHYDTIEQAFEQALSSNHSLEALPEAKQAWLDVFRSITTPMKQCSPN